VGRILYLSLLWEEDIVDMYLSCGKDIFDGEFKVMIFDD
jgi:hypothetical protein